VKVLDRGRGITNDALPHIFEIFRQSTDGENRGLGIGLSVVRGLVELHGGNGITLREVDANVRAGRRMILIKGSGRAADALVSLLEKAQVSDPEIATLRESAQKAMLTRRRNCSKSWRCEAGQGDFAMRLQPPFGCPS